MIICTVSKGKLHNCLDRKSNRNMY